MLNLLFITDSPKAVYIKSVLQPVLRIIIDVVADFDHGLKDVFEKRPATVCIQDHIGGVTGESVARHIQMLLGNSTPTFILLHTGKDKPRAISGLYEHIIDLNQAEDALVNDIIKILKTLLGDQWTKIYIPPKQTPASVRASLAVPKESREDADRLVDDFLSDLETSGAVAPEVQSPAIAASHEVIPEPSAVARFEVSPQSGTASVTSEDAGSARVQAYNDDLAELLAEVEKFGRDDSTVTSYPVAKPSETPVVSIPDIPIPAASPVPSAISFAPVPPAIPVSPVMPAAADFIIRQKTPVSEEPISEDLLLAFEENYRSGSQVMRRSIIVFLVITVCAVGGWYMFKQKSSLIISQNQPLTLISTAKKTSIVAPPAATVLVEAPPVAPPAAVPPLPSFIPQTGLDKSYAVKNPGWERYVGKTAEFRLFRNSGRIQALQVLSVKEASIPDPLFRAVLKEFTGSSSYQITSGSTKSGLRVDKGIIKNKGEIIIYRKKLALKAFVVSVD